MDWQPVIIASIVAVPPTLLGAAALVQATKVHGLVNSRMTELLELTKRQSADAATLEEKRAQLGRDASAAIAVVTLEKKQSTELKE